MLVLSSAVGLRSCASGQSPAMIRPSDLARTGIVGLCANRQAVAGADGGDDGGSGPLLGPGEAAGLDPTQQSGYAALQRVTGATPACPPTTTP